MTVEDGMFHAACFVCGDCGRQLSKLYYPHEGKHLCEKCCAARAPKCTWCHQGIMGSCTNDAAGKIYHANCFACSTCGKSILGSYFQIEDHLMCKHCCDNGSPLCSICKSEICGEYAVAEGRPYHRACFVCDGCRSPIIGRYLLRKGRPLCAPCRNSHDTGRYKVDGEVPQRRPGLKLDQHFLQPEQWVSTRLKQLQRELSELRSHCALRERKKRLRSLQLELHPDKQPPEMRSHVQPLFLLVQQGWEAALAEERGDRPAKLSAASKAGPTNRSSGEDWHHVREAWYGK